MKTIPAVDGFGLCWLERYAGDAATFVACYLGAESWVFAVSVHAGSHTTIRAALRLISQVLRSKEFPLGSRECERLLTVSARERLVFKWHWGKRFQESLSIIRHGRLFA